MFNCLIIVSLTAIAGPLVAQDAAPAETERPDTSPRKPDGDPYRYEVKIKGMTPEGMSKETATRIAQALAAIPGVYDVRISRAMGGALLWMRPGKTVDESRVRKALEGLDVEIASFRDLKAADAPAGNGKGEK